MARVTIEDCSDQIPNRFMLVQAAIRRTRQLVEGSKPLVYPKNREAVIALREIAASKVSPVMGPSEEQLPEPLEHELDEEEALIGASIEEVSVDQAIEEPSEEPTEETTDTEEQVAEQSEAEEAVKNETETE
jgi:DNA-directed RNA polymerase subunit omega